MDLKGGVRAKARLEKLVKGGKQSSMVSHSRNWDDVSAERQKMTIGGGCSLGAGIQGLLRCFYWKNSGYVYTHMAMAHRIHKREK